MPAADALHEPSKSDDASNAGRSAHLFAGAAQWGVADRPPCARHSLEGPTLRCNGGMTARLTFRPCICRGHWSSWRRLC